MVRIKLTSLFILAAFVIAPIVALPFPASPHGHGASPSSAELEWVYYVQ